MRETGRRRRKWHRRQRLLSGYQNVEVGFPQAVCHQGMGQCRWIVAAAGTPRLEFPGGIGDDLGEGEFSEVGDVQKAQRMTDLPVKGELPKPARCAITSTWSRSR